MQLRIFSVSSFSRNNLSPIESGRASRPAGRRANPPKADLVGSTTGVERGKAE